MIDVALLMLKLDRMREHIRRARRRRPTDATVLKNDDDVLDALAMSVMVAIQESIDAAFHVAVGASLGLPHSNANAFEILAKHGIISTELATSLGRAAGLRNRIVHGYASVDSDRLWHDLPDGLDDLDRFAADIAKYVGGNNSG